MSETKSDILPAYKYPTSGIEWEQITNINDLELADHISYDQAPYYHHAIVEGIDKTNQSISLIRWSLKNPTEIIRSDLQLMIGTVIPGAGCTIHRAIYTKGCYKSEEVLKRARARVGETDYHWIWNFARAFPKWCKTGRGSLTHSDSEADDRYVRAMLGEL